MKKKLTYKQKLIYMFFSIFLFGILLYKVSIAETVDIAIENSEMQEQVTKNMEAPKQIQIVKSRLKKIDQLIGNNDYQTYDNHEVLLGVLTDYFQENKVILKDFPEPYIHLENGYITKTSKFTVEGNYISSLRLVHLLEQNYKIGKVVAVDFNTTKALRTRKRKLNSTIYIQHVKAESNEENS